MTELFSDGVRKYRYYVLRGGVQSKVGLSWERRRPACRRQGRLGRGRQEAVGQRRRRALQQARLSVPL
jgi:hypothetical protein